jgi:hypothetical protein
LEGGNCWNNIDKKNLQNKKKTTKRMRIQFERKTPKEDEIWKTNPKQNK